MKRDNRTSGDPKADRAKQGKRTGFDSDAVVGSSTARVRNRKTPIAITITPHRNPAAKINTKCATHTTRQTAARCARRRLDSKTAPTRTRARTKQSATRDQTNITSKPARRPRTSPPDQTGDRDRHSASVLECFCFPVPNPIEIERRTGRRTRPAGSPKRPFELPCQMSADRGRPHHRLNSPSTAHQSPTS